MLYPHPRARHAPSHPHASSSSSLSSAADDDILPAASSIDSHSDIATDLSLSASPKARAPPKSHHRFFLPLRSTSATHPPPSMGQALTTATATAPPSPSTPANSGPGARWRAWASRRKRSEDITAVFAPASLKGKDRTSSDTAPSNASLSDLSQTSSERSGRPFAVFGGRKISGASEPKNFKYSGSPPPPPPKEPPPLSTPQRSLRTPLPDGEEPAPVLRVKGSLPSIPQQSPSALPSPALDKERERLKEDWRKSDSTTTSHSTIRPGARPGNRSPRPVSLAESSHSGNTIVAPVNKRLSALLTDAEFMMVEEGPGDAEGGEEDEREGGAGARRERSRERSRSRIGTSHSPAGSVKARNRRSVSLNLGPGHTLRSPVPSTLESPPTPTTPTQVLTVPPRPPSSAGQYAYGGSPLSASTSAGTRDTPTLTRAAASGIIAPLNTAGVHQSTGSNIRSRLAAWTSVSAGPTPVRTHPERPLPPAPARWRRGYQQSQPPNQTQGQREGQGQGQNPPPSFRQTAVSMTGSLAPAAGLAMGLGKRAVEKVLGGFSSSSSSASAGGASVPSSSASSLASSEHGHGHGHGHGHAFGYALGRTASKESGSVLGQAGGAGIVKKARRRGGFGPAPSVASSVTSSSAASDMDPFVTAGPALGRRVRGPRRTPSGASVIGGLVFKRELRACVAETAVEGVVQRVKEREREGDGAGEEARGMRPLEERLVPALVVRCAQHVLQWGMQEEGLFRVSGRSSHVARLRSEFDAGCDWDMVGCDPSDLDPHAVASIFKTYLRELPESILTATLIPYFESALAAEDQASRASIDSSTDGSVSSKAPSHQRSGSALALRKAPSLSTLAVPSFAGQRSVSESLLNALTWLISRLPAENRDLLYTVVELIKATAAHSAQTKMPLGNLLLVFCPSLNMNPTLLRVLCEHDSIWQGVPQVAVDTKEAEVDVDVDADADDLEEEEPADVRATFVTAPELRLSVEEGSDILSQDLSTSSTDEPTDDDELPLETPEGSTTAVDGDVKADNRMAQVVPVELAEDPDALTPAVAAYRTAQIAPELVLLPPISPISPVSMRDDSASFVSALEPPSAVLTRSPSPVGGSGASSPREVPPLSSSSESLSSPSEMSEEPLSPRGRPSTDTEADTDNEVPSASRVNRKPVPQLEQSPSQDSFTIPVPIEETRDMSLPRRPMVNTSVPPASVPAPVPVPAPAASVTVPFPSTGGSTPNTPVSRRKSFSLLSFPSLRSDPGPGPTTTSPVVSTGSSSTVGLNAAVPPPSSWHRTKKPSLHLLLQKLSGSGSRPPTPSLATPSAMASVPALNVYGSEQAGPAAASVPELSPIPLTMERTASKSAPSAPPQLDTAISSSPIGFGFQGEEGPVGLEEGLKSNAVVPDVRVEEDVDSPSSSRSGSGSRSESDKGLGGPGHFRSRTESYAPSLYLTPAWTTPQTPIADLYQSHSRSKSALSFFNNDLDVERGREKTREERGVENDGELYVMARSQSKASQLSVTPSIEVAVEQDDWAKSVLTAAQGTTDEREV